MNTVNPSQNRPHKLNDVQISLLRLFSRDMPDEETAEVRQLLMAYYDEKLQAELERVITERGYGQTDYDTMLNQQNRTNTNEQTRKQLYEGRH